MAPGEMPVFLLVLAAFIAMACGQLQSGKLTAKFVYAFTIPLAIHRNLCKY